MAEDWTNLFSTDPGGKKPTKNSAAYFQPSLSLVCVVVAVVMVVGVVFLVAVVVAVVFLHLLLNGLMDLCNGFLAFH